MTYASFCPNREGIKRDKTCNRFLHPVLEQVFAGSLLCCIDHNPVFVRNGSMKLHSLVYTFSTVTAHFLFMYYLFTASKLCNLVSQVLYNVIVEFNEMVSSFRCIVSIHKKSNTIFLSCRQRMNGASVR